MLAVQLLWVMNTLLVSFGYQGQPEGGRWVIVIQIATDCNSNKARAEPGGAFNTRRLNVHRWCSPLSKISPSHSSVCKYLSRVWSQGCCFEGSDLVRSYGMGREKQRNLVKRNEKKKNLTIFLSFFVSRLQTSLHGLNGHLWWNVEPQMIPSFKS